MDLPSLGSPLSSKAGIRLCRVSVLVHGVNPGEGAKAEGGTKVLCNSQLYPKHQSVCPLSVKKNHTGKAFSHIWQEHAFL